jgi:hypothetical protein
MKEKKEKDVLGVDGRLHSERDTVGKISSDLLQKHDTSDTVIDLQRKMQEEYIKNLIECIDNHKTVFHSDFFVIVITKNEKLMPNVFRSYFLARLSCPSPEYDQSVFKYFRADERAEHIWTVPSKDACYHLREHANYVVPAERGLLEYVQRFFDGSLLKLSKQLNGEQADTPFIA